MNRQLAFDLPVPVRYRRDDLIVTPANALALGVLADWVGWPGGKMLLIGPPAAGKSHLAAVWAQEAGAITLPALGLTGADLPALAQTGAVLVEDGDLIAGDRAAETAFFHLHNLLLPQGRLLVTAQSPVRDWGLGLPDLISRLQAAGVARLDSPDDDLLAGVLAKLFADRQLAVPGALIPYLLARMPRSIATARDIVAELDARALAARRPLGLRLAAELLDEAPPETEEEAEFPAGPVTASAPAPASARVTDPSQKIYTSVP